MTETNKGLVVPDGEEVLKEPTIATEEIPSGGLVVPEGEDELDSFIGVKSQSPKKETVTPIAEKKVEESVVAQNSQDALPLERRAPEEPGQSFQSVLPSVGFGSESPSSVDEAIEPQSELTQEPFSVLGFQEGTSVPFKSVAAEKENIASQLNEAKSNQEKDPLAIKEGTKEYGDLESILAPRMTSEKDIEATLAEIQNDQGFTPQQSEAAKIMAIQKKDLLLEQYEAGKITERERILKGELGKVKKEAGDDVESFLRRAKKDISKDPLVKSEVKEEFKFNSERDDLISESSVKGALTFITPPHNAYVKLAAIDRSENKAEELANYKEDLLNQISKDNGLLGNRLSSEDLKDISGKSIEDIVAISGSLAELSDKVNKVESEKQEFLRKKHKGVEDDISTLKDKIHSGDLNEEEKADARKLIDKHEAIKGSFFEKDGAKTGKMLTGEVKEGSSSYNLYREILKDIPEDLPSKQKFDMFYLALRGVSKSNLKKAGMLDDEGNYDNSIENALRDAFGIEDVLGIDFNGSVVGGLTTMEKDALEAKGKVDDLTNVFLNNTAYSSENYWDELFGSLMTGFFPETAKAAGKISDTASAGETVATLDEFGLTEGEGVDKESLQSFSELVAFPEDVPKLQLVGSTLGGSFAMMGKLMIGGAALKAFKIGKLGTALTRAEKALSKTRAGKVVASSLKQGANAEFSGELFNDKEELEFKQFFAGQMASDVIEGMMKGTVGKLASALIKNIGVNKKAAFDFAGKVSSRALGEFTEESMQQIVGAYNKSDSFKETAAELRKQFPDMDSVTEFAILTGLMGATFGLKTSYNDVRQRLKDGGYDTAKADEIMEEIGKETKKAAEIIEEGKEEVKVEGETIEEATPEVEAEVAKEITPEAEVAEETTAEPVSAPEIIADETVETEYTDKEGKFFSEEEVLNMTSEQLSEMTVKNPSEAVQAKVAPVVEVAGEVTETVEEVTEAVPEIEAKTETDEQVQTEEVTEEVKAPKQTKVEAKLEAEKKTEFRNNTLVDSVKEFNKKSEGQKKKKAGKELLDKIRKMSEDQGHTFEIKEDGSVSVTDAKGKEVKTQKEFAVKKEIPEVASQDQAWAVNQVVKKGALGDGAGVRMVYTSDVSGDVTLESSEIKSGIAQIKKGNYTGDNAKKVLAAMADSRKKGFFDVSTGSGLNVKYDSVPIEENAEGEFSEEELVSKEALDAESAAKAEEQTQAQKIQDATDAFVEKVKKLKIKPPGSFQSGGPVEVYNGAVELMAKLIHAGGSTAAAVSKAIAHIKASDWYKKKMPADRKKIIKDAEAALIENSEAIKKESDKNVDFGGLTEKQKAKKIKDEAKSKESDELLARIEDAAKPLKEGEGSDPSVKKRVRGYVLSMLTDPNVSEEVKDRIRENPDNIYDQQSNAWTSTQAVEIVESFSKEEGGLELLLEDVKNNFLDYGAVGATILDTIATLYSRDGRFNDSAEVQMALAKIGTLMGQAIQKFAKINADAIVKAYMKTAMGAGLRAKQEVKEYRDKKLDERTNPKNPKSKKKKQAILDTKEEFSGTVNEFVEKIARGDKEALAFIDKALKKSEKADAGKKKTPKKVTESRKKALTKESDYRKKRISDAKKERGKYLNSSFGLTKEGVEMVIDVAASYVRSGIINTKVLADKIRSMMKDDFDHDISDADLETVLGNGKIRKGVEDESLKTASETLAKKVLKHTESKENKKTADAVDILIKNLFAKAKETLPARAKKETDESYRKKLIEAMEEQEFAREVWDKSKNTISDILDNKQAKGEMDSAEKAQVLKELEEFFGDKVGAPFSKSLIGKSIKEQLKSDNETIRKIVVEHYSRVEKGGKGVNKSKEIGRDLAEKIVASTGKSPKQAKELKEIIEKEFADVLRVEAEKVLAKVLGVENLSQEKLDEVVKKNKVTVDAILKAVNAGALTNDSYTDAFGTAFDFATISDSDVSKINALVYDLTLLPEKSIARDMALIDFRTYLDVLGIENQSRTKRYVTGLAYGLFYQNILGNAPTVLRSAYGIINSSIIEASISIMKNPMLFAHDAAKALRNPGTTAKGYYNHLVASRRILKDALKRGYIPYESGLEKVEDSSTKLGYLDRLANADLKDLSKKEKTLRAAQWVSNKQLRLLMATDAIGHYNARRRHVRTDMYNRMLADGLSKYEKSFWVELDARTGESKELKVEAVKQAENEKASLESDGVDVSNFRVDQRANNIIFNNLKEDTQIFSDRMATQMRMGHHPKGWAGFMYHFLNKVTRSVPGSAVILPFLRIPLNMADAALDYVPLTALYRGVFGRGSWMRAQEGENDLFSSAFLEKTRSKKEHISEDRADHFLKGAIGAVAIGATIATVISQATKKDDDDDKVFQVVYNGTGSYADNKRLGIRQNHYRVKVGGKWGPWIDYRDSPLYMVLAFAGGMSDKLVYDREDPDVLINSEEIKQAMWTGAGSAIMSAKEQNFLQSASDIMDMFRSKEGVVKASGKFLAQTAVRGAKGVIIPSALTTDYNYYKTLTGQKLKKDTKIEDGAGQFMLDRFTKDIPFAEDYKETATDGLGTPIEIENKVPFISDDLVKKDDLNPIAQLTKGTQLIEKDVAPLLGKNRAFVYSRGVNKGKEIPVKNKEKMRDEYKRRLLEAYDNDVFGNLESLKEEKDVDGKRLYKSTLKGIQEAVREDLQGDSDWDYVLIER